MKKALYLDDVRTPTATIPGYQEWDVVRNFDEFVQYILNEGIPDLISFDHDLAKEHMDDYFDQMLEKGHQIPEYENYVEKTGLHCAQWLAKYIEQNNLKLNACSVHSHNPVGASNIQSFINGFKRHMGWPEDCFMMKHPFTVEKK